VAELQQNRYDKLIRRVGGIIGPGSMVAEAITELFPMIDVENVPGELLALMGTRIALGRGDRSAGAGTRPQIQLFNPDDSATILVVTSMIASTDTTQTVSWALSDNAMANLTARGSLRDTRLRTPAANASVGVIRNQQSAVPVGGANEYLVLANTPFNVSDPNSICVLSPGFGLDVEGTTDATRLIVSFSWRERTLETSEENLVG